MLLRGRLTISNAEKNASKKAAHIHCGQKLKEKCAKLALDWKANLSSTSARHFEHFRR